MTEFAQIPHLIPIMLGLTILGAVATYATKNRLVALLSSMPALFATTWMFIDVGFGVGGAGYSYVTEWEWIPALGVSLTFGVDGLSASLAWLTAVLTPLVIMYSWKEDRRPGLFFALIVALDATVIGVFTSLDLFLFYIFWEFVLIPMYFLIAIWGGPERKYASYKFFLYTGGASLVMLLGFMALYFGVGVGSFSIPVLTAAGAELGFAKDFGLIVFGLLAFGFLVKVPSVPFHTWLPDAHVQAPTAGSVILAGVLLKMGTYGIMRIAIPMLPDSFLSTQTIDWLFGLEWSYQGVFFWLGIISVLYGAFLCLAQDDLKKLIAYSSVSHMGLIILALATMTEIGWAGAAFMNVAHGIISAGMFMVAGSLQHATGTRLISRLGGLGQKTPRLAGLTATLFLASLGLPGLMGFIAEFSIFAAIYEAFGNWIWLPVWSILITAGYFLWALQRVFFGPIRPGSAAAADDVHDISDEERFPTFMLVLLTLLFGILPAILLGQMNDWTFHVLSLIGGGA